MKHHVLQCLASCLLLLCWVPTVSAESTILVDVFGANWRYLADGSDQGASWRTASFNDQGWSNGSGLMGYGFGNETVVIDSGPPNAHYITTYFRHTFTVSKANTFDSLTLLLAINDGIVIYLNGKEILRNNMPSGRFFYNTPAAKVIAPDAMSVSKNIPTKFLRDGVNIIAVELHQSSPQSPDAAFALHLEGNYHKPSDNAFMRDAYLQLVTPESAVVRWGTSDLRNSVVRFGVDPAHLDRVAKSKTKTYQHEVKLTGLTPATTYYYSVGYQTSTGAHVLSAGDNYFFKTQPPSSVATPTRIWVIGDSGRGNSDQVKVYEGYQKFTGNRYTDLWLMLGDNAYGSGTYQEYQDKFFNIYTPLLRQTVVWPTLGNHDGHSVNTPAQTGSYYENFTLPTSGEAGGVASGTEAYYSYNYGNIHFVVLDAHDVDRSATGVMAQWLEADLAANNADWLIAYWHHPPYTKGTHDSDSPDGWDFELVEMRENILPILEQHGADLVLNGHSHNYERSKFIDGHYGYSNSYSDALYAKNTGSGDVYSGASAYSKTQPVAAHSGTVYVVAGASSAAYGGTLDHPVMYRSFNKIGSLVIDIDNLVLNAKYIDENGDVQDKFTLQKLATATDDRDGDGVANTADNCPDNANGDQSDSDGDGIGDVCGGGLDTDGDGVPDEVDSDDDSDGVDDAVDNCSLITNSGQADADNNGVGDACDATLPVIAGMQSGSANDKAGYAVTFAGDVDADGYGDYAVGIPGYDVSRPSGRGVLRNVGRVEVLSGRTGTRLFMVNGTGINSAFGTALAGNADVDGDGYADIAVGAPKADSAAFGLVDNGTVTILYGPDGVRRNTLYGTRAYSLFGASVALGDVNGDGFADVIIGAPCDKTAHLRAGSVSVYSGADISVKLTQIFGVKRRSYAGTSVAAGDVDHDGNKDIIIGAPGDSNPDGNLKNAGSVAVYKIDNTELMKKYGVVPRARLGKTVAGGDINKDDYDDVIAGSIGDDDGPLKNAGSVTVFSGINGEPLMKKYGTAAKAALGNSVVAADVNGDGFDDVIVGAWKDRAPSLMKYAGSVTVFSGDNGSPLDKIYGTAARAFLGFSVGAGDIDADNKAEVLIGVPGASVRMGSALPPLKNAGAVQVREIAE